jgi:glycosyltransferase involved in cell wall biosynthesis
MKVSVLMTAYNRDNFIADAIESVLASAFVDFELIIVDDCSQDQTFAVAKKYAAKDKRVRAYQNETNLGDYHNRNKAASYANGEYLKFLDSDDRMYPHCLQVMVAAMDQYPEAGFGLSSIPDDKNPYPYMISSRQAYIENFNGYGHFGRAPGSSIIRTSAFNEMKGFSGKRMIGDNELWFKLAMHYPLVKLQRDLVWDRLHAGQESGSSYAKKLYAKLRKQVMQEALEHPSCPLSKTEVAVILKNEKTKLIKQTIKKWL